MEAKHKIQNCKLSEENRAQYINDLGVWRDFLNVTKAQTIRKRINAIRLKLRLVINLGEEICNTCN